MNVYKTDKIRNVALLGHGGAGKTTIAEAMAHLTGITSRMGNVTDGNTISDYDKEEIKRKFSISSTVVPVEYNKVKINVLDTPGYFDFVGEVEEAAGVADAAVIVISGKDGVQVGTEKAWELCEKNNLPRCFFVTNMDIGGRALSWGPAKMSFPRSWHRHLEAGGGRQPPTPPQHHVWSPPALHHILQRGQ